MHAGAPPRPANPGASMLNRRPTHARRCCPRASVACLLILTLSSSTAIPAQKPAQMPQQPAAQASGQANEATSKPIQDTPAAPMAALQATLPQAAASPLTRDEQILEILNRFTYGPRPGDLEHIRTVGISQWFSEQLNPWQIDDSALDRRLDDYPAMKLPIAKLMELYPNQQTIRATMNGRNGIPGGEGEKALYKTQEERYKEKKNGKDQPAADSDPAPLPFEIPALLAMSPGDRFNALTKLTPPQLGLLRKRLQPEQREQLTAGFTPHQIEVIAAFNGPAAVVAGELVQTKILRDIYSERQLNEVMVDFWLNHFNVYMKKSQQAPYFITSYERDVIRPRALGHFENLLAATAMSPAMLNYLDNASSIGPHSRAASPGPETYGRFARPRPRQQNKASGLNENYARELMELHTVGVNGGYTQHDVTEVARVFTGWTLGAGPGGGQPIRAEFDMSKHEPGDKMVLGVKIKQDGPEEGMKVLHLLATSPQTAHFISTKLAIRFVSDDPPPAMVERMAQAFLKTNGDIRQVLVAMIQSPEFFSRATYRAKVKTPQDYVISAVRASGAEVQSAGALAAAIAELGQPLYGMQTPNGYSMKADPWNSTAALISRMNFALALSSNRVTGVHADLPALVSTETAALSAGEKDRLLEDRILHMSVSDRTRAAILQQIDAPADQQQSSLRQIAAKNAGRDALATLRAPQGKPDQPTDPQIALAAGLIFGSPEFQRR
jgi:uncharacterized protein (DUF1800 family)